MKVLIYEQWHGGHYANYLNVLIPKLAQICESVTVAVGQKALVALKERQWDTQYPNVGFAATLPDVPPGLNLSDRIAAARNLVECLRAVRPDYTIIPSADAQSTGIAALNMAGVNIEKRFGPIEGTLHYGYGYSAKTSKERLKELIYSRTYRSLPFSSINFVNFAYYDYAIKKRLADAGRIRFVGDPVPQLPRIGQAAARELLGLAKGGRYLGMLGALDSRKAVPQLLAAFKVAKLEPDDRLLLAGRLDPEFARLIERDYRGLLDSGRLIVMDRFLSEAELEHGYEALDLATIAYSNFPGLASLALKSVAAGTPIIAHDFGWLQAATRAFEIGVTTDVFDTEAFASALPGALARRRIDATDEAVHRLLKFHSVDNFAAQMTKGVCRAAGKPDLPSCDWEWVMESAHHSDALRSTLAPG